MVILIADFNRVLTAAVRQYLLDKEDTINLSIANNNNGKNVTVILTVASADGHTDPAVIQISPYTTQSIQGLRMKALLVSGNGANISVIVTTREEIVRIEPVNIAVSLTDEQIRAVRTFSAISDSQRAPAAINQLLVYRVRNPSGSGVVVRVTYIAALCNAARLFRITSLQAIVTNRTTVLTNFPKNSLANSVAIVSLDANVASNLSVGFHDELLVANTIREYKEAIYIAAGQGLEFQIGDTTDATTDRMTMDLEVADIPVPLS